jgi:translation initiation factor IF-1
MASKEERVEEVEVELSAHDLTRGPITYRQRNQP